jgi:hypothetical protein
MKLSNKAKPVQGGIGFENTKLYNKGKYIVKFEDAQRNFEFLNDAKDFYYKCVNEGKDCAFWSVSAKVPKLIEARS